MNVTNRTYPQPDAPQLLNRANDRALAVFKYLLNLEPEQARLHPMFVCIQHAFEQQSNATPIGHFKELGASKVELISGAPAKSVPFPAGEGGPV